MWLDLAKPLLEALQEALRQHRPVEHVLRRVTDSSALDPRHEPRQELVVHIVVNDRDPERGAALARSPAAREQRTLCSKVEICVRHHDERVLAAELEARALQVPAGELT